MRFSLLEGERRSRKFKFCAVEAITLLSFLTICGWLTQWMDRISCLLFSLFITTFFIFCISGKTQVVQRTPPRICECDIDLTHDPPPYFCPKQHIVTQVEVKFGFAGIIPKAIFVLQSGPYAKYWIWSDNLHMLRTLLLVAETPKLPRCVITQS